MKEYFNIDKLLNMKENIYIQYGQRTCRRFKKLKQKRFYGISAKEIIFEEYMEVKENE